MTSADAQNIADMANAAEASIMAMLEKDNPEMLDWYLSLPRDAKIKIAMDAAAETVNNLK